MESKSIWSVGMIRESFIVPPQSSEHLYEAGFSLILGLA